MAQRGRKSAAGLATVTTLPSRMLEPPESLAPDEVEVWAHVVATKEAAWWDAGSVPLLEQYCRAVVQARMLSGQVQQCAEALQTEPDQLDTYKDLRRLQAQLSSEIIALARSMRLSQQARYGARAASTGARKGTTRKPWQVSVIEADE